MFSFMLLRPQTMLGEARLAAMVHRAAREYSSGGKKFLH